MIPGQHLVAGRCPGALEPMSAGDGLIIRVRPRLSKFSADQLEALAAVSARYGDGNLYLTNRANVHIRGLSPANHAEALNVLKAAELVDRDPAIEAIRNMMVTPAIELRGVHLANALECVLAERKELQNLPAKFGVAVQAGETLDPAYVSDITFLVRPGDIAILLDGDIERAFPFPNVESAVEGFVSAATAFLSLRNENPRVRRMRDAAPALGWMPACADMTGKGRNPVSAQRHFVPQRAREDAALPVGDLGATFGIGFAFGEVHHCAAREIASMMRSKGIGDAWLAPHRTLVFQKREGSEGRLAKLAERISGIADPADIRLRIHACQGARACGRGSVPSRKDADAVLAKLPAGMPATTAIHISGCKKQCAYRGETTIAAIGSNGRYDVFLGSTQMRTALTSEELPSAVAELATRIPFVKSCVTTPYPTMEGEAQQPILGLVVDGEGRHKAGKICNPSLPPSLNVRGSSAATAVMASPLPKGEGQGEGVQNSQ